MPTCTYAEPGTDATQDLKFFPITFTSSGTIASATDQPNNGPSALKAVATSPGGIAYAVTPNAVISDVGSLVSCNVRLNNVTPSGGDVQIFATEQASDGLLVLGVAVGATSVLKLMKATNTVIKAGTTSLVANTVYRVSVSLVITSVSNWSATLYLNGIAEIVATQADSTLTNANGVCIAFGIDPPGASTAPSGFTVWYDDIYIDDRANLSDCGNIAVTAKRSFANGTINGYTLQIGAGGSGYGSGHAPQVNERPLSETNGWSMVGAGSTITEEYNIEGLSVGDVNLTNKTIASVRGWVWTNALAAEIGKIIVDGTQSNISITTTPALFVQNSATPTVYPAGSGADIGEITSVDLTTVKLYECGIIIAYTSGAVPIIRQQIYRRPFPYKPSGARSPRQGGF